jgi:outer membrane protein assembly factor BamB
MAALCYERLLSSGKSGFSPLILFKAALAFQRAGDKAGFEQAWGKLAEAARDGLRVGEQTVRLDELHRIIGESGSAEAVAGAFDWPMFKGNPSRSAEGNGSAPFLEAKWSRSMYRQVLTEQWIKHAVQQQEERQQPVMSGYFPIAVTVQTKKGPVPLMVYRSYYGVHAVDLRNGHLYWEQPASGSFDKIAEYPDKTAQLNTGWLPAYQQTDPNLLFENSTVGTLSADTTRLFAVDDLVLPPHPSSPTIQQLQWGAQAHFGPLQEAVYQSRLQAFDLATGKFLWELGGPEGGELSETYFLGPPLPLAGKLYLLAEKASELRLLCLDAQKGDLTWAQPLANVRDRLLLDVGRRIRGVSLAYGEGILVCPTQAGAVLGVDLLSHSLVWEYSYREESPAQEPNHRFPRGAMWMNMNQSLKTEWKASAPVIAQGKVVFTAPDGNSINCLNLRDGTPIWRQNRGDDLYLGGVYDGKVVMVGKNSCRALALSDGKPLWRVDTGMPSGQGTASEHVYYLPLRSGVQSKEPEVCSIDMDKGIVLAHTRSRKKEVPGNLIFFDGDALSQTPTAVAAYPQLRVRLAQIDNALQRDPNDPIGLTDRGELKLDKGDLAGAVQDLRTALAHKPPADVLARTRAKYFETLTELFQRDFDGSQRYLEEYQELCKIAIPADASAEDRQKLQDEQQRRQANFLCLLAKGRERQGRLADAFQAYLDFGSLAGNHELISVIDEPAVKARADVWAQGRIAAMTAHATPEQRKPLEEKIALQWKTVQGSKSTDAIRKFVALFGSLFTVGKEARLYLAERLMEENAFLEAELQLLQVRGEKDSQLAGRAVEALARLTTQKNLLEDAAYWYRLLGQEYAQIVVHENKTGAELFREIAADKRFQPFLEEAPASWSGRFKVKKITSSFQAQATCTYEPKGEVLPYFQRNRLVLQSGSHLRLIDRATNDERWGLALPNQHANNNLQFQGSANPEARFSYHVQGHLIVINVGVIVYGFDPVDQKVLWEKNLYGSGVSNNHSIMQGANGPQILFPDGYQLSLGQAGPVEPAYVCVRTREGLIAIDPLRGTVLWQRQDIPVRAEVFGDDQHVYCVELHADNSVGNSHAFRAHDGVSEEVPEFGRLFARRTVVVGRKIFVQDRVVEGTRLRFYDVQTGKDLWKKVFSADAVGLKSDDPELAGVAEPKNGGKITLINLRTMQEVLTARVEPKDLDKAQLIHLISDRDNYYIAIQKAFEMQANPWGMPNQNVVNGIRWTLVNGKIYAFDRGTGKLRWKNDVLNQTLILDQFRDMPIMLFTARYHRAANNAGALNRGMIQQVTAVKSIDKRTGKLLYDEEFVNNNFAQAFYALNINRQAGTIDFVSYNLKIQHYLDPDSRKAEASLKKKSESDGKTP